MSVGRICASISLPVSAACGRMTQPYMIDVLSSNGLADCPSYRLSAVRFKLKKGRNLLGDYVIQKTQSHGSRNRTESIQSTNIPREQECLNKRIQSLNIAHELRLIFHPEICLLIISLSLALVYHPSDSYYWLNGLDRSGGISAVWRDYAQSWDVTKVWKRSVFSSSALHHVSFFKVQIKLWFF